MGNTAAYRVSSFHSGKIPFLNILEKLAVREVKIYAENSGYKRSGVNA